MTFRLLVTGTRHGTDARLIYRELRAIRDSVDGDIILVHGDAPGVDRQAAFIGQSMDMKPEPHRADWDRYGKRAGPLRNQEMVDLGANFCLAFPHPIKTSRGTYDCLFRAHAADIPHKTVTR